jgi:hypothetical protein
LPSGGNVTPTVIVGFINRLSDTLHAQQECDAAAERMRLFAWRGAPLVAVEDDVASVAANFRTGACMGNDCGPCGEEIASCGPIPSALGAVDYQFSSGTPFSFSTVAIGSLDIVGKRENTMRIWDRDEVSYARMSCRLHLMSVQLFLDALGLCVLDFHDLQLNCNNTQLSTFLYALFVGSRGMGVITCGAFGQILNSYCSKYLGYALPSDTAGQGLAAYRTKFLSLTPVYSGVGTVVANSFFRFAIYQDFWMDAYTKEPLLDYAQPLGLRDAGMHLMFDDSGPYELPKGEEPGSVCTAVLPWLARFGYYSATDSWPMLEDWLLRANRHVMLWLARSLHYDGSYGTDFVVANALGDTVGAYTGAVDGKTYLCGQLGTWAGYFLDIRRAYATKLDFLPVIDSTYWRWLIVQPTAVNFAAQIMKMYNSTVMVPVTRLLKPNEAAAPLVLVPGRAKQMNPMLNLLNMGDAVEQHETTEADNEALNV